MAAVLSYGLRAGDAAGLTKVLRRGVYAAALSKGIRLYVEYTSVVPDVPLETPRFLAAGPQGAVVERIVVTGKGLGSDLPVGRIMTFYDCHYQPVQGVTAILALARVAGYDRAALGLPEQVEPLLFLHPMPFLHGETMIATTKLSHFVRGRCAPTEAWQATWRMILDRAFDFQKWQYWGSDADESHGVWTA